MRAEASVLALVAMGLCLAGCDSRPAPASAQAAQPVFTSDSARQAQLMAFRQGLPEVHELENGSTNREALVLRFLKAVEARDTADLREMALSRAEFGWIYYPTNPQARPPYDLDPGLFWFMLSQHGGKGLGQALETLGGLSLRYVGHSCDPTVSREEENTVYGPCLVKTVQARGDTAETRMFGPIIEWHGRWKFVSYANKMD